MSGSTKDSENSLKDIVPISEIIEDLKAGRNQLLPDPKRDDGRICQPVFTGSISIVSDILNIAGGWGKKICEPDSYYNSYPVADIKTLENLTPSFSSSPQNSSNKNQIT